MHYNFNTFSLMKHLDFIVPLVVVVVFCTLPFLYLGFLNVAHNKDIIFGVFLQVVGVALPVVVAILEYKYNK